MPASIPFRARRTALIAAVLLALLLAQTIGLLHRLAHGIGGASQTATATMQADSHDELKSLFGGHDQGSGSCDIYDQLTHADALWSVPALVLPLLQPMAPVERHASWHLAAQSAGFLARGPPDIV